MKLYGDAISGNCYKVQLLLEQIQRPFDWIPIDLASSGNRTGHFLQVNPNGEIPVLELDDGRRIAESNAILCYLAEATGFLPDDSFTKAQVLQWLFFEQNSHQPFVASARYIVHHLRRPVRLEQKLQEKMESGYHALEVMDRHLRDRVFFVNDQYTIADIALYAYTHVAEEGGFDLERFPALLKWLERVQSRPHYVPMNRGRLGQSQEVA
jgi:glutathione S-transferase